MTTYKNDLYSLEETASFIQDGKAVIIAGDESLLGQLPKGNWIGGTMHYFMGREGGVMTSEKLFVNFLDEHFTPSTIRAYTPDEMSEIPSDYPESGASFIIIPALSECIAQFASETCFMPEILNSPLVGWGSGVIFENVGKDTPKIVDGTTGEITADKCIVMHCELPENLVAVSGIINIFEQGDGDTIEFEEKTTTLKEALINGERRNYYDYVKELGIGIDTPMVTDFAGAKINMSIAAIDDEAKEVRIWNPVLPGYEYKFASPVTEDYEELFGKELKKLKEEPVYACNCLYNYFFGQLEGKKTGEAVGPISFGEIAYLPLNQTMVYLTLKEVA